MFLTSGPQEWLSNFFVDQLNYIFTGILDLILYGVMGMLFKVYLLIGSFDLFGGFSDGTEAAMKVYQDFSNRLYGALGVIVMFVLAYQIIMFIIVNKIDYHCHLYHNSLHDYLTTQFELYQSRI